MTEASFAVEDLQRWSFRGEAGGGQAWETGDGQGRRHSAAAEGAKEWQWEAPPKDGFHVLRHTWASIMLPAGKSVATPADGSAAPFRLSRLVTMLASCRRPEARDVLP